ncbi:hypothetical protein H4R34_001333 [Dimargaris verticillata]|uniref:Uncharacterized protein n=1 Tax=Dimargaris verticillata TaxID=2761393 RepID=A0A9W8B6E6_9FUNG|nr:hypothetical protein H4R34_001333 [Dimargaris verticillata]
MYVTRLFSAFVTILGVTQVTALATGHTDARSAPYYHTSNRPYGYDRYDRYNNYNHRGHRVYARGLVTSGGESFRVGQESATQYQQQSGTAYNPMTNRVEPHGQYSANQHQSGYFDKDHHYNTQYNNGANSGHYHSQSHQDGHYNSNHHAGGAY